LELRLLRLSVHHFFRLDSALQVELWRETLMAHDGALGIA